ncbi:MAG: hypothetical protein J1D88_09510 [Treponema sp.]|nr:hypothetical protein [Treponema sp.]
MPAVPVDYIRVHNIVGLAIFFKQGAQHTGFFQHLVRAGLEERDDLLPVLARLRLGQVPHEPRLGLAEKPLAIRAHRLCVHKIPAQGPNAPLG